MSETTVNNSENEQSQNNDAAPKPPEGLAANFWDTEKNEIKISDLIADHSNLSKFKTETEERFKERPESPEKYELRLPEGVELPEGLEFEFQPDSPLAQMARQIAFDSGRGQKGFDELVAAFVQHEISKDAEDKTAIEETYKAEMQKLGERGKERTDAADAFLKANLSEDEYDAINSIATSAIGVQAIEKLMSLSKDKAPQVPDGNTGAPKLTLAELKSMQADPKYWREQDPAFIKQVSEGFKQLYPGQQQTSH